MRHSSQSYPVNTDYGGYLNHGYSRNGGSPPRSRSEMMDYPPQSRTSTSKSKKSKSSSSGKKEKKSSKKKEKEIVEEEEEERGEWGSKAEFILSCIGYSVGLGNVWRFPYLAFNNGGAAFLIPYIILLVLVGKPLYYMETALGQFSRCSSIHIWNCAPLFRGVGAAMLILSLFAAIYYNVIMAYSVVYIGASIRGLIEGNSSVPWANCNFEGSNENCTLDTYNLTQGLPRCYPQAGIVENCTYYERPSLQFWEKVVLNTTKSLPPAGDVGGFDYHLPLSLLFSWIIVFLCLMKGVKSSGKVVYFTATFPYFILIALMVRGLLLEGAMDGLKELFIPVWSELLSIKVWKEAAEQMFFSLGISWGGLMMFGSFNKFHNKINIDATIVSIMDFLTSILSSVVVFCILGNLSYTTKTPIRNIAAEGPSLAFVIYPEALSTLSVPWLWSILFFLMLFFLGLDSEFAYLETVLNTIYDQYPKLRKKKTLITFIACSSCYLIGLSCCSRSGIFIFNMFNSSVGTAVLFVAFWEIVGFSWAYGFKNICRDIKLMLGKSPGIFWKVTWGITSPITLLAILIASLVLTDFKDFKYSSISYPFWGVAVYWALILVPVVQVPLWAIFNVLYYAIKGKIKYVIKPTSKWGPGDPKVRRALLDQSNGIVRQERNPGHYSYDNQVMGYDSSHI